MTRKTNKNSHHSLGLTTRIMIAMLTGIAFGALLHIFGSWHPEKMSVIRDVLDIGGKIFIITMKMVIVPVVFVSLVCGTCNLGEAKRFGNLALKTIFLYLVTTALAITLALFFAALFNIGANGDLSIPASHFTAQKAPTLKETIINIFPANPIASMAEGNMLQVIVFSILFGMAIAWSGKHGERIGEIFKDLNEVVMKLISMLVHFAPYGVFCLISLLFAKIGFDLIYELLGYFITVVIVLMVQLLIVYPALLQFLARLNPFTFLRKMLSAMLFAFSTSSSSVSIPVVLETVEHKLGVKNSIASFIIPLGATINMDGTAIMQGVATVFIANVYHINIGLSGYLTVVFTATLASIGTAGVPGVGLITLITVLQQVGLPIEGIALIIGVDRILDMIRTAVNITGDASISCIVAKSEKALDENKYKNMQLELDD
ncbi:MAG: dicarboxylate/amino acid:cation symporter [Gammaproteobacteria bacterium]